MGALEQRQSREQNLISSQGPCIIKRGKGERGAGFSVGYKWIKDAGDLHLNVSDFGVKFQWPSFLTFTLIFPSSFWINFC